MESRLELWLTVSMTVLFVKRWRFKQWSQETFKAYIQVDIKSKGEGHDKASVYRLAVDGIIIQYDSFKLLHSSSQWSRI